MGSEMCIRDRSQRSWRGPCRLRALGTPHARRAVHKRPLGSSGHRRWKTRAHGCLASRPCAHTTERVGRLPTPAPASRAPAPRGLVRTNRANTAPSRGTSYTAKFEKADNVQYHATFTALAPGGIHGMVTTCWRCGVPGITERSSRCLHAIGKDHRGLRNSECFP